MFSFGPILFCDLARLEPTANYSLMIDLVSRSCESHFIIQNSRFKGVFLSVRAILQTCYLAPFIFGIEDVDRG